MKYLLGFGPDGTMGQPRCLFWDGYVTDGYQRHLHDDTVWWPISDRFHRSQGVCLAILPYSVCLLSATSLMLYTRACLRKGGGEGLAVCAMGRGSPVKKEPELIRRTARHEYECDS